MRARKPNGSVDAAKPSVWRLTLRLVLRAWVMFRSLRMIRGCFLGAALIATSVHADPLTRKSSKASQDPSKPAAAPLVYRTTWSASVTSQVPGEDRFESDSEELESLAWKGSPWLCLKMKVDAEVRRGAVFARGGFHCQHTKGGTLTLIATCSASSPDAVEQSAMIGDGSPDRSRLLHVRCETAAVAPSSN